MGGEYSSRQDDVSKEFIISVPKILDHSWHKEKQNKQEEEVSQVRACACACG